MIEFNKNTCCPKLSTLVPSHPRYSDIVYEYVLPIVFTLLNEIDYSLVSLSVSLLDKKNKIRLSLHLWNLHLRVNVI